MQLKNNLYTIAHKQLEEGYSGSLYELELIPSSVIYQAHFPGEPITPGVCIVQMGKELVEDALQQELHISYVKNVKFLSILTPTQSTSASFLLQKITFSEGGKEVKAQIVVTSGDEAKAKLSMILRPNL